MKEKLPARVTMVSGLSFLTCSEFPAVAPHFVTLSLCPWQDNHEEDYFLYVAYSDESVYGK